MEISAYPIYHRLHGETDKAFEAFRIYRDMGSGRSIDKVARELHKSHALISRWNSRFSWSERIAAWEAHLDQVGRQEVERSRKDMVERHIKISTAMQSVGAAKLTEWQQQIQAWHRDPEHNKLPNLSPSDMLKLIDAGIKVERLSRGEPVDAVDVREIVYTFIYPKAQPDSHSLVR